MKNIIYSIPLLALMLTGCGSISDAYENVVNESATAQIDGAMKYGTAGGSLSLLDYAKAFVITARGYAFMVICGSIILGCLVLSFIKNYKPARRAAIFVLIIGIPLLTLVAVFGSAIIINMFS